MAQPRTELQTILETLLGTRNVYFQPPQNIEMQYPCIVYERQNIRPDHANNELYKHLNSYQITYIDRNPDSAVPEELVKIRLCSFDRHFRANNLNHDVFTLFF